MCGRFHLVLQYHESVQGRSNFASDMTMAARQSFDIKTQYWYLRDPPSDLRRALHFKISVADSYRISEAAPHPHHAENLAKARREPQTLLRPLSVT